MRWSISPLLAVCALLIVECRATAQVTQAVPRPVTTGTDAFMGPSAGIGLPANVQVVVVGKVVEVEPDVVEVPPFRGAPKDRMLRYKVANLKIEDRVFGASGVTRIRVGYLAEAPDPGAPGSGFDGPRITVTGTGGYIPNMGIALKAGTEGCFSLSKHANADFYVVTGPLLRPKDPTFTKEVSRMKKAALAMNDPVAALKAKELDDRFEAARIILNGYLMPRGSNMREAVPDEETKIIVSLLVELPWNPPDGKRTRPDGRLVPHRSILWYSINPGELGFKRPEMPKRKAGEPPVDAEKLMDEATTKFLKENGDKIKLKRFVQK